MGMLSNLERNMSTLETLLINLKDLVVCTMRFPRYSFVCQHGLLERLRSAIFAILIHGLKRVGQSLLNSSQIDPLF